MEEYPGLITSDLFGEDSYFADADLFWQKQNEAIATKRDTYLERGLERGCAAGTGPVFPRMGP
ncbi:hypothetical protein NKI94_25315 [Mesorhizobium australicum]|uniref:hypothetical protein n=1 Tax=Mesorhizobium australicum TaxID=536018 RepID=UPI00333D2C39